MRSPVAPMVAAVFVLFVLLPACGASGGSSSTTTGAPVAAARLEITALAGPVCPVESDPPNPECAPRPVPDALMIVTAADGSEVARGTTASDGTLVLDVPAGELIVVPQPVEGLLGTAAPIAVTVATDQSIGVTADYDTGIR